MSVYHAIFLVTLLPAVFCGVRQGGDFLFVAMTLLASFAASYFSFETVSPVMASALSDLMFSAAIALFCRNRTSIAIGVLFAIAAQVSIIYGMALQPGIVYNRTYAHILSVIGHIQNLALLYGAADGGIRNWIDRTIRSLAGPVVNRGFRHSNSNRRMDGKG